MAELNQSKENASGKIRSKKLNARVDLTAMVDLAFLLITFFMLTTSLTNPHAMALAMPGQVGKPSNVDENRTLTILLGKDDKAQCFMGKFANNKPKQISVGTRDLREEVVKCKKKAATYTASIGKPDQGLIVLIKPGEKSEYGNLVDVLDEMAIVDVPTYAIADLTPDEKKFLHSNP